MLFTSTFSGPDYRPSDEDRLARLGAQFQNTPGFTESLALQTWQSMTAAEQSYRLDAKNFALEQQSRLKQELYWFEQSEVEFFVALNEYHHKNMDVVVRSEHYKPEERAMIIERGLLPYAIPKLRRYALSLLGEMAGAETEIRAKARTPDEEPFAEAVNTLLRYYDRESNWRMQKHLCRQDALVGSRAIAGVRRDPMNMTGGLLKRRYRPEEFMWQTKTAFDPSLKDCTYMERICFDLRASAMCEFPEFAEEIRDFNPQAYGVQAAHIAQLDVLIRPRVEPPAGTIQMPYNHDPQAYYSWRDTIFRREFFRKHPVTKWRVIDPYRGKVADFPSRMQAEEWRGKTYKYWKYIFAANGFDTEPMIGGPNVIQVPQVDRCTLMGDILVRVEPFGEAFPYDLLAPEMLDGGITSLLGHGQDLQRMMDRAYMHMEDFAGAAKGKTLVNKWMFQNEMSIEDIKENLTTNELLVGNWPPGTRLEDIMANVSARPYPQIYEGLRQISNEAVDELLGGENMNGGQQTSQESGVAVMARESAGSRAMIPYQQQIDDWEEAIGKKEVQVIQQFDPITIQMVLRREDPQLSMELMGAFAAHGVESLAEIDLALELVETQASPSTKDRILNQVFRGMSQAPQIADAWSDVALENMDVDDSVRKKVEAKIQAKSQFDQQMQMEAQRHQQDMETKQMDLNHLDRMIRLEELKIKANPPFSKSVSVKLPGTPGMIASVANGIGMEADARGVAMDMAAGAVLHQGELDMQQQHRNENLLPAEIKGLENKAKSPYRNPVPSADNASARSDKADFVKKD